MKYLLLIPMLMVSLEILAQEDLCDRSVTGKVLDLNSKEPLPFAAVKLTGTDRGVITDAQGVFDIPNICEDEIHLEVRFIGYKTVIHHHDFHHGSPVILLAADETLLESVVVEDERSTRLVSMAVQQKKIDELSLATSSIGELTKGLSGVTMLNTGSNISKPMIHGLHSNRVLLINDGVRHGYQVWGDEHAPEIDPSHVDEIQIVKGAGTVKYGPDALGGVILYNSKKPEFDKNINGSVVSSYQTNGRALINQVNISQGMHRFAWDVGGYATYQGDKHAPDYNLTNTGKREYGGSFNTFLHQPDFDLQISGSYFQQELGILRGSIVGNLVDLQNAMDRSEPNPTWDWSYDIQNPRQETEHSLLKTNLSFFPGSHIVNIQYGFQYNIRREYDVRRGELNDRPVIDLTLISHNIDTEWIQPINGRWSGNSGIQFIAQNSVNEPGSNPVNFVPDYEIFNIGAFSVQSLDLDETTLELGARIDFQSLSTADTIRDVTVYSNKVSFTNATFTLGVKKQMSKHWSLSSNIGSAWRPPNVAELYSFGYHQSRIQFGLWRYTLDPEIATPLDRVFNQSDREVPPERSIKWLAGLETKQTSLEAEFVLYANLINNYIFLRPYGITTNIAGTFPYFIYDQIDALFMGGDADIRINHSNELTSEIKLAYVFAMERESKQELLGVPPVNLSYDLEYKKGAWNYSLNLNYTTAQWNEPATNEPEAFSSSSVNLDEIFDFMEPPEGYLLVGSEIGYERKSWKALFKVDNLLNTSYRSYTDMMRFFADSPGRNFSLAIEFNF